MTWMDVIRATQSVLAPIATIAFVIVGVFTIGALGYTCIVKVFEWSREQLE